MAISFAPGHHRRRRRGRARRAAAAAALLRCCWLLAAGWLVAVHRRRPQVCGNVKCPHDITYKLFVLSKLQVLKKNLQCHL